MAEFITKIRTDEGDKQIDYNALANLPELNTMFSNPNLLINSDFRNPVNQRGLSTYSGGSANTTTNLTYTIDRWVKRHYGSTVVVNDGYVRFQCTDSQPTDSGSKTYAFTQAIEKPECLFGITCTLSAKVKAVSGAYRMGIWQGSKAGFVSQVAANGIPYKEISQPGLYTVTFTVNSSFADGCNVLNVGLVQFSTMFTEGSYIDIEWIKLEQGSIATPFAPRLYAEEVMLCQRYYRYFDRTPIFANSSTSVTYYMPVQFGVPMRSGATKSLISVLNSSAAEQTDITLVQCVNTVYNVANIQFSKTIGQYGFVTIAFDAEIY